MCGILGQMAFADSPSATAGAALLAPLIDRMARRGPDDGGIWSDGRHVTLAHRRLAILDLAPTSHQPMLSNDGRYAIVYNGEIYNYNELRQELENSGVRFRSRGDTEVALYALAHWGERALGRFNGMFALGFYDSRTKRLLLARDHAGIKPLYYSHTSQGLLFASQFDQVLDHPWTERSAISPAALGLYLRLGYIPAPYALLENSYMLEPGTWLSLTCDNQLRQGRYFEFPAYREPRLCGAEADEAVDAAMTAAVRRQLVSDVPVGTFLSGGIDSPLVTAKYRAVSNHKVRAFTIGTQGDLHDESKDATNYASELGVEHFVEPISKIPPSDCSTTSSLLAASLLPIIRFFRHCWSPGWRGNTSKSSFPETAATSSSGAIPYRYSALLANLAAADSSTETATSRRLVKMLSTHSDPGDTRWPGSVGEIYRLNLIRLSEPWLKRIFPDLPEWPAEFSLFSYTGRDANKTAQWLRWNDFASHLAMVLLKVDRGSMFHSLEVRVPILDREVIEVATQIDWRTCLDYQRQLGKLPLRHLLARYIVNPTLEKRGFTVAMDSWLRGPLRAVYEELVLCRKQLLGLPLNQSAVREMFERHLSKKANFDWLLWTLLSLALWEERHLHGRKIGMTTGSVASA